MRFSTTAVSSLSLLALAAAQQNHSVDVGLNGLTYTPNSITAAVGDIITFTFHPKNHSLTQSTFTAPCVAAFDSTTGQAGFDTGFVPVASGSSAPMSIRVTTATPLWFFCRQATHCQSGMVFAVNPTANKTFAEFQAAAMQSQPQVPGQTAVPAASAPPAGASAPPATAPAPTAPAPSVPAAGSNPAATAPGADSPAPPAASGEANPYGTSAVGTTDGTTPTDSGVAGLGAAPSSTAKPNGAVALSPRSAVFAAAFLVGAGMLL